MKPDSVGILLGFGLDSLIGDPQRLHPVAGFGTWATQVQQRMEKDSRTAGALFTAATIAAPIAAGVVAHRATRNRPALRSLLMAAATWTALGTRTLDREATRQQQLLEADDLDGSRDRLGYLCGRDPELLDEAGLTRAVCESVAENTNDATVATLLWAGAAGIPGVLGWRAINTLDAMVGHHSDRYENFGWASARLDDVAGFVPARVTGALAAAVAPMASASRTGALSAWRRDAKQHPSPNAGVAESSFAGALGVRLGGPINYRYGPSQRPWLNADGADVTPRDIGRTVRLARWVALGAAGLGAALAQARGRLSS